MDNYIPVLEKKTTSHSNTTTTVWTGRIINLPGFIIKGENRDNIEAKLEAKLASLPSLAIVKEKR